MGEGKWKLIDTPLTGRTYVPPPAPDRLALAVEALERMREGWANALELDIILPQHRTAAAVLRDEAARALAAIKAST